VSRGFFKLLFAIACLASLVVLFSPGSDTPDVSVSDKLVHAALFAALAVTGVLAGVPVVVLAPALVVYAGLSEVLQAVLPIDRDGDWRDSLADTLGTVLGLVLVLALLRYRRRDRLRRVGS
jgi:VanZ family protein